MSCSSNDTPFSARGSEVAVRSVCPSGHDVLVSDGGLDEPDRGSHPDPRTSETGRGVWLVDAFAERWGTEMHGRDGKTVWCELSIESPTNR